MPHLLLALMRLALRPVQSTGVHAAHSHNDSQRLLTRIPAIGKTLRHIAAIRTQPFFHFTKVGAPYSGRKIFGKQGFRPALPRVLRLASFTRMWAGVATGTKGSSGKATQLSAPRITRLLT